MDLKDSARWLFFNPLLSMFSPWGSSSTPPQEHRLGMHIQEQASASTIVASLAIIIVSA